jgi:hypothetical protein
MYNPYQNQQSKEEFIQEGDYKNILENRSNFSTTPKTINHMNISQVDNHPVSLRIAQKGKESHQ